MQKLKVVDKVDNMKMVSHTYTGREEEPTRKTNPTEA